MGTGFGEEKVPRKASGMAVQGVMGLRLVSPEAVWWSSLSGRCEKAYCICPVKTAVASGFLQPESSGFPLLVQGNGHQCWQKGAHLCRREPTAGQALPVTLLQVFRGAGGSRRPQVLCCLPHNPFHCSAVTRNS